VLFRQILVFLFPSIVAIALVEAQVLPISALNQFPTLIALGLSIIIFWVVELPLLMKADIIVTFGVDDGNDIAEAGYINKIVLDVEKENIVNIRVHNLGFSTLKNAMIEIYFGDGFEVVPWDYKRYKRLDFNKKFSIQKTHCGVVFTPNDNFQTIPPQEILVFQTIMRKPKNMQKGEVTIQFSSENSWGLKKTKAPIEFVKK